MILYFFMLLLLLSENLSYSMNSLVDIEKIKQELHNQEFTKTLNTLAEVQDVAPYISSYNTSFFLEQALERNETNFEDGPLKYIFSSLPSEEKLKTVTFDKDHFDIVVYQGKSVTLPRTFDSLNNDPVSPFHCFVALAYLQHHRLLPLTRLVFGKYTDTEGKVTSAIFETNFYTAYFKNKMYMKLQKETLRAIEEYAKSFKATCIKLTNITRIETNNFYSKNGYQQKRYYWEKNLN